MPEIAKKVTVDLARKKLLVDGVEFPWMITESGPTIADLGAGTDLGAGRLHAVSLGFFADDVEVLPRRSAELDAAQLRVKQAQRGLADANHGLMDAQQRLMQAQREFEAVNERAKTAMVDWSKGSEE